MTGQLKLNAHEMLELHEIIRSEVTCAKKTQANIGAIMDADLKSFHARFPGKEKENNQ
ncbi:MAG: hypothetical protein ACOX3R_07790 [Desulfitobacteriia bacterium]